MKKSITLDLADFTAFMRARGVPVEKIIRGASDDGVTIRISAEDLAVNLLDFFGQRVGEQSARVKTYEILSKLLGEDAATVVLAKLSKKKEKIDVVV